ncbi:MAG TPA: hypothetical protein PLJ71_15440 [Candidatus Hydrogenedentes bacterium]|nr:hypothetical protein [Candidatus Hydrogenedentota bacterium]HQM50080.1 hypothetical protein [Candidatus Hydrogenedentota bacterium]
MRLLAIVIAFLQATGFSAADNDAASLLRKAFGPLDAGDAIGNGKLTVTFSNTGRVASVHWPSPGYFDQLTYSIETDDAGQFFVPQGHGLCWATRSKQTFSWETQDDLQTCMTDTASVGRYASPQAGAQQGCVAGGGGQTGTPLFFVHGKRDILVARFRPDPLRAPAKAYWCANFTPCTRLIPELPVADSVFDYANDFAVFTPDNGRTIVHFRPQDLRGKDWVTARELARSGGDASAWQAFDEGIWIAQSPSEPATGFQCGVFGDASSAFEQVKNGALEGRTAAVGDCDSAFEFTYSGVAGNAEAAPVTVYIAFGNTYSAAIENLDYARGKGYDELLREASDDWVKTVAPSGPNTDMHDKMLEVLLTCMDRESGALVRIPLANPPLHVDIPQNGVMGAYALSVAGRHDLVRKRIDFYLNALRTENAPGCPAGSLPAGLYANGTEAVPSVILDTEAVAWILWLCNEHANAVSPEERAAFLDAAWPKIELAAEFLEAWADPRTGLPRTAFNPERLRDDQRPELVIRTWMGLDSALALAKLKGQERPEWRTRVQELEAVVRDRYLDTDGFWRIDRPERFWNISLVPRTHPRWQTALENSLESLFVTKPPPETACEIIFAAAVIPTEWTSVKEMAGQLLETGMFDNLHIAPALGFGSCVPDSYLAALQYVARVETRME